ncbi:hypothetical protein COO60DRAFT_1475711 [Scenedesmus sp. NREL 46B-D3]|nr:hypothetical protein COO60DRAFT_1475711 [Scenedesmus sp. NREL 46B-D3]
MCLLLLSAHYQHQLLRQWMLLLGAGCSLCIVGQLHLVAAACAVGWSAGLALLNIQAIHLMGMPVWTSRRHLCPQQ